MEPLNVYLAEECNEKDRIIKRLQDDLVVQRVGWCQERHQRNIDRHERNQEIRNIMESCETYRIRYQIYRDHANALQDQMMQIRRAWSENRTIPHRLIRHVYGVADDTDEEIDESDVELEVLTEITRE